MLNLEARLSLLGWTPDSNARIAMFRPTFQDNIDRMIRALYDHLLKHPECAELLSGANIWAHLVAAQRAHWLALFECTFDEAYITNAIRIGQIHHRRKVPPYIYMGAYNFFLGETLCVAASAVRSRDLPPLLADVSCLIALDMYLSLSAYVRRDWADDIVENVFVVDL